MAYLLRTGLWQTKAEDFRKSIQKILIQDWILINLLSKRKETENIEMLNNKHVSMLILRLKKFLLLAASGQNSR